MNYCFFSKSQLTWSREVILKKVKPVFIIYSFSFQPWQQRKLITNRKADEFFKRLLLVWRKKVTSYGVVYILMCLLWSCKLMLWDFRNFSLLTRSLPECLMEFCKVNLTYESVDEILWCDDSNETSSAVLSHGTIYSVCSSNFWVRGWNPMMWPFKWKLSACTVTFCYLFVKILESEIWKFGQILPLATFGSERVKQI